MDYEIQTLLMSDSFISEDVNSSQLYCSLEANKDP